MNLMNLMNLFLFFFLFFTLGNNFRFCRSFAFGRYFTFSAFSRSFYFFNHRRYNCHYCCIGTIEYLEIFVLKITNMYGVPYHKIFNIYIYVRWNISRKAFNFNFMH